MGDQTTTISELRRMVQAFADERQWRPFHTPKNLSMAIATEAAELMEHFRWSTPEEAMAVRESAADMQAIREELADIFCFTISFANALDIDMTDALRAKMVKNAEKYPVEKFQGRFR